MGSMEFPVEFSTEQQRVLHEVSTTALQIIDYRFGTGFPDFEHSGVDNLDYHNGHHNRQVGLDGARVAAAAGFSPAVVDLSETAGHAHDLVQLLGRGVDERSSAEWLERALRDNGFDAYVAKVGGLAIVGTEPLFQDGRVVGQVATHQDYPTKEAEQVALSVASGDMGEIYTPQGPYVAHQLWREIQVGATGETPVFDPAKFIGFQRNQLLLQDTYTYPLSIAREVLATHETEVREYSEHILAQLEAGDITSLEQLLAQDMAFYLRHAA